MAGSFYVEFNPPVPRTFLEQTYNLGDTLLDNKEHHLELKLGIVKLQKKFQARIFLYMIPKTSSPVIVTIPTAVNYVSLSPEDFRQIIEDRHCEEFFTQKLKTNMSYTMDETKIECNKQKMQMQILKTKTRFWGENSVILTPKNYFDLQLFYIESIDDTLLIMEEVWADIATQHYENVYSKLFKHYAKHKELKVNEANTRKKLRSIYYKIKGTVKSPASNCFSTTILGILISTYFHKLTLKALREVSYLRRGKLL